MGLIDNFRSVFSKKSEGQKKSPIPEKSYYLIQEFQFQNLIVNRVPCLIIDMRVQEAGKPAIKRAVQVPPIGVVNYVKKNASSPDFPLLIFCDDGTASVEAAGSLSKQYFNIAVLEGGIRSLSEQAKLIVSAAS